MDSHTNINLNTTQQRIIKDEVKNNPNITIEEFKELVDSVTGEHWFDNIGCGLDEDGLTRLEEAQSSSFGKGPNPKLLRYLKQLKQMKANVPDYFYKSQDIRKLYMKLCNYCIDNDIPKEIVQYLVPSFVEYITTGYMRPTILVGGKGCGKTTALSLLCNAALSLPTEIVKVPQLEASRGLTGETNSYQDADCGILVRSRIRHNTMLLAFIFDEIDKVVHTTNHSNVDDELLSVTDSSVSSITDNFLECGIVALEHCPMFFTANDLSKINPILADRCKIIHFPEPTLARIKSICNKFANKRISNKVYSDIVELDFELLDKYLERLHKSGITSLRKYEQFIENVLQITLSASMVMDSGCLKTSEEFFKKAEMAILKSENKTRIGFVA